MFAADLDGNAYVDILDITDMSVDEQVRLVAFAREQENVKCYLCSDEDDHIHLVRVCTYYLLLLRFRLTVHQDSFFRRGRWRIRV